MLEIFCLDGFKFYFYYYFFLFPRGAKEDLGLSESVQQNTQENTPTRCLKTHSQFLMILKLNYWELCIIIFANQVMIIFALKKVVGHSLQEPFSTTTKKAMIYLLKIALHALEHHLLVAKGFLTDRVVLFCSILFFSMSSFVFSVLGRE